MVDRPYVPLSIKACGMAAQERLPFMLAGTVTERGVMEYCQMARRVAVGLFLNSGVPEPMFEYLGKSSGAWAHYYGKCPEGQRVVGRFEPLLDAVASGDLASLRSIDGAAAALREPHEYEEEHLYARLLLALALGQGDARASEIEAALERYSELSGGDLRLTACQALHDGDAEALAETAAEFAESHAEQLEEQIASGQYDMDHRATTGKVSVELVAWARLAAERGMEWPDSLRLCPPTAVRFDLAGTLNPEGWKTFPIGGDLTPAGGAR